jgi:hypothetical protein
MSSPSQSHAPLSTVPSAAHVLSNISSETLEALLKSVASSQSGHMLSSFHPSITARQTASAPYSLGPSQTGGCPVTTGDSMKPRHTQPTTTPPDSPQPISESHMNTVPTRKRSEAPKRKPRNMSPFVKAFLSKPRRRFYQRVNSVGDVPRLTPNDADTDASPEDLDVAEMLLGLDPSRNRGAFIIYFHGFTVDHIRIGRHSYF